jgi:type VI secretion system secreted protein Hcp
MAFDCYMKMEGLPGEAIADGHVGETEIYSWSFGASNPTTIGPGTEGSGAGRVSVSSFNFMKKADKTSPSLFNKCCTGGHIPTVTITMRKAGGKQGPFLIYDFTQVFVDSIQWSGAPGGDDAPTESCSFSFAQVKIKYQLQDAKGDVGRPVLAGWNLQKVIAV